MTKTKKAKVNRQGLPNIPSREEAASMEPRIMPDGFSIVRDLEMLERVRDVLTKEYFKSAADIFIDLGKVFDCNYLEICLLQSRAPVSRKNKVTGKSEKVTTTYFRYAFRRDYEIFPLLRKANEDNNVQWLQIDKNMPGHPPHLDLDAHAVKTLVPALHEHFAYIVDVDSMAVLANSNKVARDIHPSIPFIPVPFHIPVHIDDVMAAISEKRPHDEPRNLKFNDGEQFVPFPEDTRWTRFPFLLFYYQVPDGVPRYVSYSTLGQVAEDVIFLNSGDRKTLNRALARFHEAARYFGIPVLENEGPELAKETEGARTEYQGIPEALMDDVECIRERLPGMQLSYLCSDYMSLVDQGHGADIDDHGIIAYVHPGKISYCARIAEFFGYGKDTNVVIFSRNQLKQNATAKEKYKFQSLVAHEVAHILVDREMSGVEREETIDGQRHRNPHCWQWGVLHNVLECIIGGNLKTWDEIAEKHQDDLLDVKEASSRLLEASSEGPVKEKCSAAVLASARAMIDIRKRRLAECELGITTEEIMSTAMDCIREIESYLPPLLEEGAA